MAFTGALRVISASARSCALTIIIGREPLRNGKEKWLKTAITAVFHEFSAPMTLMSFSLAYGAQAYFLDNLRCDMDFLRLMTSKARSESKRASLL